MKLSAQTPDSSRLAPHQQREITSRKIPPPRVGLEAWVDGLDGIEVIHVVRQSSTAKSYFQDNFERAMSHSGDPDVKRIMELSEGGRIVLPEHSDLRDQHGVYTVTVGDLTGGDNRKALVAYAVATGKTLFLFVLNSAHASTLKAEHAEDQRNPFTEMLRSTIRRLSLTGRPPDDPYWRLTLRVPENTRLSRNERHLQSLLETMRTHNVLLDIGSTMYETREAQDRFIISLLGGLSQQEFESIVNRLYDGKQTILYSGDFYGGPAQLPFTHQLLFLHHVEGGREWAEKVPHKIVPLEEAGAGLLALVDQALALADASPRGTVDWTALAEFASDDLGIESRLPAHVRRGGRPIKETAAGGYGAIRRLVEERYILGWMTGWTYSDIKVPEPVPGSKVVFDDSFEIVIDKRGIVRYRVPTRMPLPEINCERPDGCSVDFHWGPDGHKTHGWPVSDAKWTRLLELRHKKDEGRPSGGPDVRGPLVGLTHDGSLKGYLVGDTQYRLERGGSGVYQLRGRLAEDIGRGWDAKEGWIHCSMNASELHNSVGVALEQALCDTARRIAPLHPTMTVAAADTSESGIAKAKKACEAAQTRVAGATRMVAMAMGALEGDPASAELQLDLSDAEAELAEARVARHTAARVLQVLQEAGTHAPAPAREAITDVFDAAAVAVALQSMDGGGVDRRWNDVIRAHVPVESVRFELDEHGGRVRWRMSWRLQDDDNHTWFEMPVTGEVRNVMHRRSGSQLNGASVAGAHFFLDARPFNEVAELMGHVSRRGEKNSQLNQLLHEFLAECVPVPALRTALIDSPHQMESLRRTIYAHVVGDPRAEAGIPDAYRHHILQMYGKTEEEFGFRWGWGWCGSTHVHERAILAAVEDPTVGISLTQAIRAAGTTRAAVLATAAERRSKTRAIEHMPPRLLKQYLRTDRLDDSAKMLRPIPCPHPDCSGRHEYPVCSVVLWTPETASDAVLCPSCRRMPSNRRVVFPSEYGLPWRGRTGPDSEICGARDSDGSHLDARWL